MIQLSKEMKIFLRLGRTDFRKSVNGLSLIVGAEMDLDPLSGNLFVFCNKGRNKLKILYWDRNGFCLWYKRLEEDKFRWPKTGEETLEIRQEEFIWLLRGLDFRSAHTAKSYEVLS